MVSYLCSSLPAWRTCSLLCIPSVRSPRRWDSPEWLWGRTARWGRWGPKQSGQTAGSLRDWPEARAAQAGIMQANTFPGKVLLNCIVFFFSFWTFFFFFFFQELHLFSLTQQRQYCRFRTWHHYTPPCCQCCTTTWNNTVNVKKEKKKCTNSARTWTNSTRVRFTETAWCLQLAPIHHK